MTGEFLLQVCILHNETEIRPPNVHYLMWCSVLMPFNRIC